MILTEDFLRSEYIGEQRSCREIAEDMGVVHSTVRYNLLKNGITLRTRSHAQRLSWKYHKHPGCGVKKTKEHSRNISEGLRGRKLSAKHCQSISESHMGNSSPRKGIKFTEEQRRKHSAIRQGILIEEWKGYVSLEPYCYLFNFSLKEKVRNRDNRACVLCGKSEIHNGERLSVHHVDGNKMQGCDSPWHLVALCRSCNATKDTIKKEFLLVSNLRRSSF